MRKKLIAVNANTKIEKPRPISMVNVRKEKKTRLKVEQETTSEIIWKCFQIHENRNMCSYDCLKENSYIL